MVNLIVDRGVGAAERTHNSRSIPSDPVWQVKRENNRRLEIRRNM